MQLQEAFADGWKMPQPRGRNISIEILRTVVTVADAGTVTKAAKALSLSQPAVSAQLKRLQQSVGDQIFQRSVGGGTVPTSIGNTLILLARKTLDAHDQILRLGQSDPAEKIRLGISPLLVSPAVTRDDDSKWLSNVVMRSDRSIELGKSLLENRIDIACCLFVNEVPEALQPCVMAESTDELVWVKSQKFVLSPGRPLPIVTWRNDDWLTRILVQNNLSYQIVFDGEDFEAKRCVVGCGRGISVMPSRSIPADLMQADDYYLPKLPTVQTAILVGSDRSATVSAIAARLKSNLLDKKDVSAS